jgi:Lipocalin-like domain
MRKMFVAAAFALLLGVFACKKSNSNTSPSNARTVANFSGQYTLTGLKGSIFGVTEDLYDSLPACEQDNVIQLNANLTAQFIDSGTKCNPPSDSTGVWSLSSNTDTIYVANSANFINSWDGTTLVLTGFQDVSGFQVSVTTTLVKKN